MSIVVFFEPKTCFDQQSMSHVYVSNLLTYICRLSIFPLETTEHLFVFSVVGVLIGIPTTKISLLKQTIACKNYNTIRKNLLLL
jgi:hypothetical protein